MAISMQDLRMVFLLYGTKWMTISDIISHIFSAESLWIIKLDYSRQIHSTRWHPVVDIRGFLRMEC